MIIELAGHGSLYGHIQKTRGQPDMELSVHWATGVARGMNYLHENYVVHRDLKSANGEYSDLTNMNVQLYIHAQNLDFSASMCHSGDVAGC